MPLAQARIVDQRASTSDRYREIRVLYRWRHDGKSAAKQGTCRKRYNDLKEARRRALEVYAVCIRRADGGKTATRGLRRTENAWSARGCGPRGCSKSVAS